METPKVFESEYRFCLILWATEPIKSRELARLCAEQLGWKTTTTYTVIKRLSDRGILKNENTVVSSLVSKEQVQMAEMSELIERRFEGSVPAFLATFARKVQLSEHEIDEIQEIINQFKRDIRHD